MPVEEINVNEFAKRRATTSPPIVLDVREPFELARASLPDVLHIPMRELPGRLSELSKQKPIAVLCHHGGRSEHVARFLVAQGFEHVANVDGGIDAYARIVDTKIPRY